MATSKAILPAGDAASRPSPGAYASGGAPGGTPGHATVTSPPTNPIYPLKLAKLPQPQNKLPQPGG